VISSQCPKCRPCGITSIWQVGLGEREKHVKFNACFALCTGVILIGFIIICKALEVRFGHKDVFDSNRCFVDYDSNRYAEDH
jgi:hypothetical protein